MRIIISRFMAGILKDTLDDILTNAKETDLHPGNIEIQADSKCLNQKSLIVKYSEEKRIELNEY